MSDIHSISFDRQTKYCDPNKARGMHITIIGLGTVGSNAAVEFTKLGVGSLHLIDMDTVEKVNLPSQHYWARQVGEMKAEACKEQVLAVNPDINVSISTDAFDENTQLPGGIVIVAVDNMDTRQLIVQNTIWRDDIPAVLETRMSGDVLQIFAFDPCDPEQVEDWQTMWFPQDEAQLVECGGQSVSYIGAMAGGFLGAYVAHIIMDKPTSFYTGAVIGSMVGGKKVA